MKKSLSSIRFTQIGQVAIFFCVVTIIVGIVAGWTLVYKLTNLVREAKYDTAREKGLNLVTYIEDEIQRALEQSKSNFSNISEATDILNKELKRLGRYYLDIKDIMVMDIKESNSGRKIIAIWPPELMGIRSPCNLPFNGSIAWHGATRHKGLAGEGDELCLGRTLGYHTRPFGIIVIHQSLDIVEGEVMETSKDITITVAGALAVMYLVLGCIAFRSVQEVRKSEREKENSARLAALGNLAAGIAHEIRNPLNTISLTCQYLQRLVSRNKDLKTKDAPDQKEGEMDQEISDNFRLVSDELTRLKETIEDFIKFAKPSELRLERVEISELLSDTFKLFEQEFRQSNINAALNVSNGTVVMIDTQKMRQVFTNVIRNAIQAMPDGGNLKADAKVRRGRVHVVLEDSGTGISADDLDRIFEPYFSTKRNGLGLGLALSRNIVESHHGRMEVRSTLGKGTTLIIDLPCQPDQ